MAQFDMKKLDTSDRIVVGMGVLHFDLPVLAVVRRAHPDHLQCVGQGLHHELRLAGRDPNNRRRGLSRGIALRFERAQEIHTVQVSRFSDCPRRHHHRRSFVGSRFPRAASSGYS